MSEPDILMVPDQASWRAWLDTHEDSSDGVWLLLAKKGVQEPTSLSYAQALEEALCSGWIDGQVKSVDAQTYRQRFTPRRTRSIWSVRNVEAVTALEAAGRLRERGTREVERAKADGRWDRAYHGPARIQEPDDLLAALAARPAAAHLYAHLTAQNRYAILHRLATASTTQTRARRLAKYVDMLEQGQTPYPQKAAPEQR